ncbi:two-component system activity regulator YycH [Weissella soli]|uniref:two-component system activity regulator YycH n=1 Tax=Weissella soli TaxID=155866 RepID=UPI001F2105A4|nr:two-component system activity regulator YycH [Weissella soli]GJM48722.1 hypothetical protein WSSLDB02_12790 [Weissella soli]
MMKHKQWATVRVLIWQHIWAIGTGVMILLSVFLSLMIWFNSNQSIAKSTVNDTTGVISTPKSQKNIYAIEQLLWNNAMGQHEAILDFRPTTRQILKRLSSWSVDKVKSRSVSRQELMQLAKQKNTAVLGFGDGIAGEIVSKVVGTQFDLPANGYVFNVVVPLSANPHKVYFLDDKHLKVYEFTVTHIDKTLKNVSLSQTKNRVPVKVAYFSQHLMLKYTQSLQMATYSYLLASTKVDTFVTALFADSQATPRGYQEQANVIYNDGDSKQLTINTKKNTLQFDNYHTNLPISSYSDRLHSGYTMLKQLQQLPDNLYYFESHHDGRDLVFRLYSNGLPIFNQNGYGTVVIKTKSAKHVTLEFSQYILQVPLPVDDDEITEVVPTDTVLATLAQAGYHHTDIADMRIGYTWETDSQNENIVVLKPEWYVELSKNETWHPVSALTKEVQ